MTEPALAVAATIPIARKLLNKNFGVETFKFNRWSAELDETQTLDDAMRPEFFAEQAALLMGHTLNTPKGVGDIIVVRKLDTGDYWELIVREIGKGYIKTQLIAECKPVAVAVPEGALTTKWNVGKLQHEVIRKDNKTVMASGFQTKEKAAQWIAEHLRAMAA